MGIRLYFRNKYKDNDLYNEFCLGKLFYYIDSRYKPRLKCVEYLEEENALDHYIFDIEDYNYEDLYECFLEQCSCCPYIDYDDNLFELSTEQLIKFVYLYCKDYDAVWNTNVFEEFFERIIDFIAENEAVENRWLFRLGA